MIKPKICCASLIISCILGAAPCSIAQPSSSNIRDINFGLAVFNCCKHFELGVYSFRHSKEKSIGVNFQDKAFRETSNWVFNKFESFLDGRHHVTTPSEYYLVLFSEPMPLRDGNSVTGAILMEIPLNAETLGPKYVDKIAELRNVMTDTEVKSR